MLQKYDKVIAATALAFAALSGTAAAGSADSKLDCDLTNGFASGSAAYTAEANACQASAQAPALRRDIADGIRLLSERHRAKFDLAPLAQRASLDAAAQAHAQDMAARAYASHTDPEGRGHLHRVRMLDRSLLVGAAGANVAALKTNDASTVFTALTSDLQNMENLTRGMFSHMGVGVAEGSDGLLYVAQVFVQVDGELNAPLPNALPPIADIQARFVEAGFRPVGWALEDRNGDMIDRGLGRRVMADLDTSDNAYLTIKVDLNGDVYSLRGPAVSGR
ncbi:MAG: CAP domain-containing protein [Pseudomonadota bacterium]